MLQPESQRRLTNGGGGGEGVAGAADGGADLGEVASRGASAAGKGTITIGSGEGVGAGVGEGVGEGVRIGTCSMFALSLKCSWQLTQACLSSQLQC